MSELSTTVLGAALGLVTGALLALLANRKQLEREYDIELRKRRIEAYQALWKTLEPLAYYSPPTQLSAVVVRGLAGELRRWYYEVGGLFLSEATREAYFDLQKGLGGVAKEDGQDDHLPLDSPRHERLRAAASKLRTASTRDVATRVKPRYTASLWARLAERLRRHDPVELTVRRGWLWTADERECYTILVRNSPSGRTVELTRVYLDAEPPFEILADPFRLRPGNHWEIAVPADDLPVEHRNIPELIRAKLADGTVIDSRPGPDVEPHPEYVFGSADASQKTLS